MKTRLNDERANKILLDPTFNPDLNKVLRSQLNYDLNHPNQPLTNQPLFNHDRHLPSTKFNPYLLNVSAVNYDFGYGAWLKVVFFARNTMKINAVDSSPNVSQHVNSSAERLNRLNSLNGQANAPSLAHPDGHPDAGQLEKLEGNEQFINNNEPIQAPRSRDYAWSKHLVAGGMAGVASRSCTAPLDRIKVLLQVRGHELQSIRSCASFIRKEGGMLAFWRGNGINCIKIAPEIALRFMFYEQFKRCFKGDSDRQLEFYERMISGSLAGSLSQSLIYPMEVIKTRLCLRTTGQYNGILDAVKKLYRINGLRAFYRGFYVNLAGILPYSGIDLAVYETLKNFYLGYFQNEDPNVAIVFCCGITSNVSGQLFSYPLALIRTRLQAIDDKKITFQTVFGQVWRNSGFFGFYRGFFPNMIKVVPANVITYIVYEKVRQFFNVKMT